MHRLLICMYSCTAVSTCKDACCSHHAVSLPIQFPLPETALRLIPSDNPAETGDLYDDNASEISLEVGAEAGPEFETQVQERLQSASVAQSGPTTDEGVPTAVAPQHSSLRRFSKDHAVSDDIQKRFMIAVEDDEKAAKKRVQEWLVRPCALWDIETPLCRGNCPLNGVNLKHAWGSAKLRLWVGECTQPCVVQFSHV